LVQPGDAPISVAARYGVSASHLARTNGSQSNSCVWLAQRLLMSGRDSIPGHPTVMISPASSASGTVVKGPASDSPSRASISVGLGPQHSEFVQIARGMTDANGRSRVHVPVQGVPSMTLVFAVAARARAGVSPPDAFDIANQGDRCLRC